MKEYKLLLTDEDGTLLNSYTIGFFLPEEFNDENCEEFDYVFIDGDNYILGSVESSIFNEIRKDARLHR